MRAQRWPVLHRDEGLAARRLPRAWVSLDWRADRDAASRGINMQRRVSATNRQRSLEYRANQEGELVMRDPVQSFTPAVDLLDRHADYGIDAPLTGLLPLAVGGLSLASLSAHHHRHGPRGLAIVELLNASH